MLLFTLMVLCDAFYYSVKQGRMMRRALGGMSGELSLLCDLGQIMRLNACGTVSLGLR